MPDIFFEVKQLYKEGKYRQALLLLQKMKKDHIDNPDIPYFLGLCYSKVSEWDEAIFYLEAAVNTHKDALRVYQSRMILSYIYTTNEKKHLAEFELNKLISEGYESPQVYSNYSYIYYEEGDVEKSIDYLNKALEIDSENATALNSLGYILADKEIDLEKALALCKHALKIKPDNPAYLDSLGWAKFKNKNNEEARYFLKRAFELAPDNRLIAHHLRVVIDEIEKV